MRLRANGLDAVRAYLEQVWGDAAARFRLMAENTRQTARRPMIEPLRLDVRGGRDRPITPSRSGPRDIGRWWPADHTATGERRPDRRARAAASAAGSSSGRPDGVEIDWGEITVWEPPQRFVYQWHLRRDREDATEVEIRFVPIAARTTRGRDRAPRMGAPGGRGPTWRDRNRGGWGTLLPHYPGGRRGRERTKERR